VYAGFVLPVLVFILVGVIGILLISFSLKPIFQKIYMYVKYYTIYYYTTFYYFDVGVTYNYYIYYAFRIHVCRKLPSQLKCCKKKDESQQLLTTGSSKPNYSPINDSKYRIYLVVFNIKLRILY